MKCPNCSGTGLVPLSDDLACRVCGGTGRTRKPKGLTRLATDLKSAVGPSFEDGTVIRWTRRGAYRYGALFVESKCRWYTTSQSPFVPGILTYGALLKELSYPDVTDVQISGAWLPVA